MRTWTTVASGLIIGLALAGCEEKKSGFTVGKVTGGGDCSLTLDGLADTEWVFLRANPDKSETPDHTTRLKFFNEGGAIKAKYNVGSNSNMYTYNCEKKGEELICKEEAKVKDWCQALLVGGADCSLETLHKFDASLTAEGVKADVETATANLEKYKKEGGQTWESFKLNNNNLGNKLQGLLYVKVDKNNCRIRATDNYVTIYNGKRIEDSNPAGTNPFVKNEMGELLWDNCTNQDDLVALKSGEFPADPQKTRTELKHAVGESVHYWYLAGDTIAPIEGCSFTYDVWFDGKPGAQGQAPSLDETGRKPRLKWHHEKKWAERTTSANGNVTVWVIQSKCDDPKKMGEGWKDGKRVACNAVLVQ